MQLKELNLNLNVNAMAELNHGAEVGMVRGAVADSETLEDLGCGTVADRDTQEDPGCGAETVLDWGSM